jgi:hypothetical protein
MAVAFGWLWACHVWDACEHPDRIPTRYPVSSRREPGADRKDGSRDTKLGTLRLKVALKPCTRVSFSRERDFREKRSEL